MRTLALVPGQSMDPQLSPESWHCFDFEKVAFETTSRTHDTTTTELCLYLCCPSTLLHSVTVKEYLLQKTRAGT